ncbi:MAG: DNA polymerase III subunit gamma/tau [Wenzhouxiangella sp.]|nr:MAG: DNA polymerase III subunit gamma/tau [Wenzhouxiangella sp.]
MSYQVLARKWRPRNFAELVGQSHVVQVLSNGLASGRIHHAFLFTGTRGVGKTTIARILAKSLNCLEGISAEPCGVCEHCVAIDEGRFVDLLEIDAASRTKVDDTREILDNVQYAPARGRFKVYLIDEVHMLSTHSFNALLKTLEEPPEHVKFVLATTDPQKIPVTILSRCLQFNLRRLKADEIRAQMEKILESEAIGADEEALALLARAADGSMRDGLSLLDQALASGSRLAEAAVRDMLGSVEQRHVHAVLAALADGRPAAAIEAVGEVFAQARSLQQLLVDLAEGLHRIALIQTLPDYRDDSRTDWEELLQLAARMDPEDVQLYYQIAVTGRRDLGLAPSERSGCEMTLLRMFAFTPDTGEGEQPSRPRPAAAAPSTKTAPGPAAAPDEKAAARPEPRDLASHADAPAGLEQQPAPAPPETQQLLTSHSWPNVLAALELSESFRTVAGMLALGSAGQGHAEFTAARDDLFMVTERFRAALEKALAAYCNAPVRISIQAVDQADLDTPASLEQNRLNETQAAAEAAIDEDPLIQRLRQRFDAEVVRDSIRPVDTRSH